ncbi:MAG TPA: hypothetical protein VLA99_16725 [Nitrospiraceae bacterium]|nr:hypothetical protein [Nitrospiraceae bacterium]
MRRTYEPVDVMALLGLVALVVGAYLLLTAPAGGAAPPAGPTSGPTMVQDGGVMAAMYWVQPALGEAIVEKALLERGLSRSMGAAVADLNRAMLRRDRIEQQPLAYLEAVATQDAMMEANHAARVQTVMGRSIVIWTQRGVRIGLMPSTELAEAYTRRMIGKTQAQGMMLEDEFDATRQPNLGAAIVEAARDWETYVGETQQRLGRAIMQVVKVQDEYAQALAGNQEQLAALVSAVARTEARADVFARLMQLDPVPSPISFAEAEPISTPSRPSTMLVALWSGLAGFAVFLRLFLSVARVEGRVA